MIASRNALIKTFYNLDPKQAVVDLSNNELFETKTKSIYSKFLEGSFGSFEKISSIRR